MKVLDWLNTIMEKGLLCEEYTKKVKNAHSKKELFDIVCDVNGISFIPEMAKKGYPLDPSIIEEEFGKYINGQCKPKIGEEDAYYTSSLYCGLENKTIELDTTVACFINCKHCVISVKDFLVTHICVDSESIVRIECPENSRCNVDYFKEDDGGCIMVERKDLRNVNVRPR